MSDFFHDLKRYGKTRAFIRDEHRDRVREFKARQMQLAALAFWFLLMFAISQVPLLAAIAICMFSTSVREITRMRAVGRYQQTKRSVEVIGICLKELHHQVTDD